MATPYSVLVNSTDSYADCWPAFFKLLAHYWPGCSQPIYLGTESASFSYPGLTISPLLAATGTGNPHPSWSECLLHAFDVIDTDIVLYLQEDYFLHAPVQAQRLQHFVDLMQAHDITYLGLSEHGNTGPFHRAFHPELWAVDAKDPYRISLQACLINTRRLRRYVRHHEDPWQFEFFGNKRARRTKDAFFTVNRNFYAGSMALLPYEPTGIVNRKWVAEVVVDLFARHHIQVDYSERGFYDATQPSKGRKPLTLANLISRFKSLYY